jgi:hypothetical protein
MYNSNSLSFVISPIELGIEPLILLNDKSRIRSSFKLSIDAGITPSKLFCVDLTLED